MRTTNPHFGILVLIVAVTLALGACSESSPEAEAPATTAMGDMDMDDDEMDHESFDFGEPADTAAADRVIELVTRDDFTYSPANISIKAGETITFRVTNEGVIAHDFTLGRSDLQDAHDIEMADMGGMPMADEPNAFMIEPGETKELAWHFTEPGEVLIGCHVVGHYAAGMKATIDVEA